MGFRSKIRKAVKKTADTLEDFVNGIGDAVGESAESAGDWINDALTFIGDKVGIIPVFSWPGGIIKEVFSLIGATIKGVFGLIGGLSGGIIKFIGGIFTWHVGIIPEGIWDIFSPVFGTGIVVLGKIVTMVQLTFFAQGFERPLTEYEKSQLKRVFRNSLNYYVIRIIEGRSGLFGINSRAFTLGNTIFMKTYGFPLDLLVHETTHIWQYQKTGNRYASDALTAQWFVEDEYNWEKEINDRNKHNWTEFNNESQAGFLQDLWISGELRDSSGTALEKGNGSFFDDDGGNNPGHFEAGGINYTGIATKAVIKVRNEWS